MDKIVSKTLMSIFLCNYSHQNITTIPDNMLEGKITSSLLAICYIANMSTKKKVLIFLLYDQK